MRARIKSNTPDRLALNLVELRALPLTATNMSVGLPNSPLTIYLYALPMLIWKIPSRAKPQPC